ncbi:hypothetical protein TorRG33x02_051830 [Trema orientale]|uniref:Uncharacterized protein n=1 Tax=Trema orientale TaxID=63057 RepID=A0A2P5FME4_TREOI|nr:hypothetical protein TorRG33x02_051830 [Trema orientale]
MKKSGSLVTTPSCVLPLEQNWCDLWLDLDTNGDVFSNGWSRIDDEDRIEYLYQNAKSIWLELQAL